MPVYPATITRDETYKLVYIDGADLKNGALVCGDWDEIWVRVIPHPVASIDGVDGPLPWANYIYIKAEEVWDPQNSRIDVGERYEYAVGVTLIDTGYGGVEYRIGADFEEPLELEAI